ncbi:MAG: YIP1 family protein [Acidobacteriota bacterium]|nr:YIP1 family protein [Acidobacteriota bacterium]
MVRRTYTYVVFGVGLLLLIAGALKLLPGGLMVGGSLCFLGLVLFGLSFVPRPAESPEPPLPFHERLAALFFEPSRVFRSLRAHPRWLAALLVIVLLNFAYSTAFTYRLTPERIVGFTIDKVVESGWMPPEMAEQQKQQQIEQAKDPVQVAGGAVTSFAWTFVLLCALAALALLGVLLLGGRINFWQSLAVLAHAWLPVVIISQVLNLILLYIKDPDDIHPTIGSGGLITDNLGALFSPAEHPVLFAAASAFGVLTFYGVWLTATGLRHGGERVSSGTAWTVSIAFWVIRVVLAVAASALFGNFMA